MFLMIILSCFSKYFSCLLFLSVFEQNIVWCPPWPAGPWCQWALRSAQHSDSELWKETLRSYSADPPNRRPWTELQQDHCPSSWHCRTKTIRILVLTSELLQVLFEQYFSDNVCMYSYSCNVSCRGFKANDKSKTLRCTSFRLGGWYWFLIIVQHADVQKKNTCFLYSLCRVAVRLVPIFSSYCVRDRIHPGHNTSPS